MYSVFDTGFERFMFGGFTLFPIIFGIVFILVFGVIGFVFAKGISQWNKNNHSPVLTVDARLVAKRTNVSHHHNNTEMEPCIPAPPQPTMLPLRWKAVTDWSFVYRAMIME